MVETPYKNQSRVFLALAGDELSRGDLYQAAEKGWGAAAQIVKAAADGDTKSLAADLDTATILSVIK